METGMLRLAGMKSAQCADVIAQALKAVDGVSSARVSLDAGKATVVFDETVASLALLKRAVLDAGYEIAKPAHGEEGGCCGGCGG